MVKLIGLNGPVQVPVYMTRPTARHSVWSDTQTFPGTLIFFFMNLALQSLLNLEMGSQADKVKEMPVQTFYFNILSTFLFLYFIFLLFCFFGGKAGQITSYLIIEVSLSKQP